MVSLHGKCNGSNKKTGGRDAKHTNSGLESSGGVIFLWEGGHMVEFGDESRDGDVNREMCNLFG